MWRLWAKALGEKASRHNKEADRIALIRTLIFISYLTTNLFIISGVIRHWSDNECKKQTHSNQQNQSIQLQKNFEVHALRS